MTVSKSFLQENSSAHPAISPSDIAQIMSKKLAEGFSPSSPHRTRVLENDSGFVAADFRATSQLAPEQRQQDPIPQETHTSRADAIEAAAPLEKASALQAIEPVRDFDAELKAAFEKGFQEGLAQGFENARSELKAGVEIELLEARDLFLSAAKTLAEPPEAVVNELSNAILAAVGRLTSECVGIAIDEHPQAFLSRIQNLADRVAQGVRQVAVHLNMDDLQIMKDHLTDLEDEPLKLIGSKTLRRGEVEVRGDGIRLRDLYLAVPETRS